MTKENEEQLLSLIKEVKTKYNTELVSGLELDDDVYRWTLLLIQNYNTPEQIIHMNLTAWGFNLSYENHMMILTDFLNHQNNITKK